MINELSTRSRHAAGIRGLAALAAAWTEELAVSLDDVDQRMYTRKSLHSHLVKVFHKFCPWRVDEVFFAKRLLNCIFKAFFDSLDRFERVPASKTRQQLVGRWDVRARQGDKPIKRDVTGDANTVDSCR